VPETIDGSGDPKWGLRVIHVDRAELNANAPTGDAKLAKAIDAVRECVRSRPGIAGTDAIREVLGGTMATIRAAVHTLIADSEVVERKVPGRGNSRRLYLAHMTPTDAQ
jgi:hypothetical protein